jgi:tyrosine-protein phosphatase YwqE
MKKGFETSDIKTFLTEINKVSKDYKKIKKYMKSSYYQLQVMNGTERIVNELVNKYYKKD